MAAPSAGILIDQVLFLHVIGMIVGRGEFHQQRHIGQVIIAVDGADPLEGLSLQGRGSSARTIVDQSDRL
jgi:hypothetical protein